MRVLLPLLVLLAQTPEPDLGQDYLATFSGTPHAAVTIFSTPAVAGDRTAALSPNYWKWQLAGLDSGSYGFPIGIGEIGLRGATGHELRLLRSQPQRGRVSFHAAVAKDILA